MAPRAMSSQRKAAQASRQSSQRPSRARAGDAASEQILGKAAAEKKTFAGLKETYGKSHRIEWRKAKAAFAQAWKADHNNFRQKVSDKTTDQAAGDVFKAEATRSGHNILSELSTGSGTPSAGSTDRAPRPDRISWDKGELRGPEWNVPVLEQTQLADGAEGIALCTRQHLVENLHGRVATSKAMAALLPGPKDKLLSELPDDLVPRVQSEPELTFTFFDSALNRNLPKRGVLV